MKLRLARKIMKRYRLAVGLRDGWSWESFCKSDRDREAVRVYVRAYLRRRD